MHRCSICHTYAYMGHTCLLNAPAIKKVDTSIAEQKKLIAWDCECDIGANGEAHRVTLVKACEVFSDTPNAQFLSKLILTTPALFIGTLCTMPLLSDGMAAPTPAAISTDTTAIQTNIVRKLN